MLCKHCFVIASRCKIYRYVAAPKNCQLYISHGSQFYTFETQYKLVNFLALAALAVWRKLNWQTPNAFLDYKQITWNINHQSSICIWNDAHHRRAPDTSFTESWNLDPRISWTDLYWVHANFIYSITRERSNQTARTLKHRAVKYEHTEVKLPISIKAKSDRRSSDIWPLLRWPYLPYISGSYSPIALLKKD